MICVKVHFLPIIFDLRHSGHSGSSYLQILSLWNTSNLTLRFGNSDYSKHEILEIPPNDSFIFKEWDLGSFAIDLAKDASVGPYNSELRYHPSSI